MKEAFEESSHSVSKATTETVSVVQAARMVRKSRATLYRMADQGKLSVTRTENGAKGFQVSELLRVFGASLRLESSSEDIVVGEKETDSRTAQSVSKEQNEKVQLEHRIDLLEAELRGERRLTETLRAQVDSQTLLIGHQSKESTKGAAKILVAGIVSVAFIGAIAYLIPKLVI